MKGKIELITIAFIVAITIIFECLFVLRAFSKEVKNPFISPFKIKQYEAGTVNPLSGINLEGLIASHSDSRKNIAIINNKPYYTGSKIMGKTIVGISKKAVYIKLKDGKIIRLSLAKIEGFK